VAEIPGICSRNESKNRVNETIGKPLRKLPKTSAEAKQAIGVLEDTISTLKRTRDVLSKELETASRDFRIAQSDIEVCIMKIIETAPEVERLLNDLAVATTTYCTLQNATATFVIPERLKHLASFPGLYQFPTTLSSRWAAAIKALHDDASAPLPS
jgi:hypothetical protein